MSMTMSITSPWRWLGKFLRINFEREYDYFYFHFLLSRIELLTSKQIVKISWIVDNLISLNVESRMKKRNVKVDGWMLLTVSVNHGAETNSIGTLYLMCHDEVTKVRHRVLLINWTATCDRRITDKCNFWAAMDTAPTAEHVYHMYNVIGIHLKRIQTKI